MHQSILHLEAFADSQSAGAYRTSAERFLTEKPGTVELVLTGRGPAEIFLDAADYVSEINCVKHPYTHGIAARRGIEF